MELRVQRGELPVTACKHSQLQLASAHFGAVIRYKGQGKQHFVKYCKPTAAFSRNRVEAQNLTSTGAGARQDAGIVSRAVADERHGLHPDGGDDKLADFARRQGTARLIYDLGDDMVFPQMHPLVGRAADRPAQRHFPRTVVGEEAASEQCFTLPYYSARAGVPAHKRPPEAAAPADTQQTQ